MQDLITHILFLVLIFALWIKIFYLKDVIKTLYTKYLKNETLTDEEKKILNKITGYPLP